MSNYLEKLYVLGIVFLLGLAVAFIPMSNAQPSGGTVTPGESERLPADAPDTIEALAGNVTQVNINGESITRSWQGYFGNVTGTLVLGDVNNFSLYEWSVANPRGQVYFSTNSTILWQYTQCFNYTAAGTFADDTANAGATSQFGMNLTQLHSAFNILSDHMDSVDRTYNITGAGGHDLFHTGSLEFTEGECQSAKTFVNSTYQTALFDNALLYEPNTTSVIFASIVEYQGADGFDNANHDFQALVLEDGHGTDTATTTYYVYVELE